jgi:hypothetical protein
MFFHFRQSLTMLMLFFLGVLPLLSGTKPAEDHLVTASDLRQAVRTAAQSRDANLAKIEKFFSTEAAKNAFETVKLDPAKVTGALALLSDEELARLAVQSEKIQNDVAAGALTNQQITYILIALATAVLILVIVAAR